MTRRLHRLRWALCQFCNGNGCRWCDERGEFPTEDDY